MIKLEETSKYTVHGSINWFNLFGGKFGAIYQNLTCIIPWYYPLHRSLPCWSEGAWVTQQSYEPWCAGPPKTDRVIVESPDECHPLKNGKPLQCSGHKNSMNYVKWQKCITPKDKHPQTRSECVQYVTGEEQRTIINNSKKMKQLNQSRNDTLLWMRLMTKVKSHAVLLKSLEC